MATTADNIPATLVGGAVETIEVPVAPSKGGSAWQIPTKEIPPQPVEILHLPLERAAMLAALPRKHWSEFTWAALGGAIAAAPSAIEALWDGFQSQPFALHVFQFIQVLIFFGFAVWFFVARGGSLAEKTAAEYLKELRGAPPKD